MFKLAIDRFHMTSRGHICVQNNESAAIFVYKKNLWELNSFHMLKLSFIPSNFQSCWPRDWKRAIGEIVYPVPSTVPEVFAKVNSFQFPSLF